MGKLFTTVSRGMSGYYAILCDDKPEEGPIQTGIGRYPTLEQAAQEAAEWAEAENINCVITMSTNCVRCVKAQRVDPYLYCGECLQLNERENPIQLWTDGSGTELGKPGGWAAILIRGEHRKELSGGMPDATNNRAELMGVIGGLKALKPHDTIRYYVQVYTDSKYVMEGITSRMKRWKSYGWRRAPEGPELANADLWEELYNLCQPFNITAHHVHGHRKGEYPENERADKLAGQERERMLTRKLQPSAKKVTL